MRAVNWPPNFKITGVQAFDGKMKPELWLNLYSIAVRAGGGNSDVMANYLPVMLTASAVNWLASLPPNSIDRWEEL